MDKEAWHAAIHRVIKSTTWLSNCSELKYIYELYFIYEETEIKIVKIRKNASCKTEAKQCSTTWMTLRDSKHACVLQCFSCRTLWASMGILQAILEWVAFPYSRGSSEPRDQTCLSYVSRIGRQVFYLWCQLRSPDWKKQKPQTTALFFI